jgi:hypothetical protein
VIEERLEFAQIPGVEGSVESVAIGFRGSKGESGSQRGEAEEQRFLGQVPFDVS